MTETGGSTATELRWHRSSFSYAGNNCLEVASAGEGRTAVRDSKDPGCGHLLFGPEAWSAFLTSVRRGDYGPAGA